MTEIEEEHEDFAAFTIGTETYGVDILKARDIIGMAVSDVIDVKVESIHESPHYSANIREDFIKS